MSQKTDSPHVVNRDRLAQVRMSLRGGRRSRAKIETSTRRISRIALAFFELHVLESSFGCVILEFVSVVIEFLERGWPLVTCGGPNFRPRTRISTRTKLVLLPIFSNSYVWSSTNVRLFSGVPANVGSPGLTRPVRPRLEPARVALDWAA